ncbi:hypothetical protein COW64_25780 [bacterium (Candidatus Blackallbacteria) CG18_big_fil_WC_8_21_14_2_50_49_26]|nr:MAG: hypothetical protein COW64_25780 [bacterium (Candidatus Blackallbacteria) CG18_big_fil_WC_8_21_14_2_50_49_26]
MKGDGRRDKDKIDAVVDYYLTEGKQNMAASLRANGYAEGTCKTAYKWFMRPHVQARLVARRNALVRKVHPDVTREEMIERLRQFAFGGLAKFIKVRKNGDLYYDFCGATTDELSLVHGLTVEPRANGPDKIKFEKVDPLKSMELLAKLLGFFDTVGKDTEIVETLRSGRQKNASARKPRRHNEEADAALTEKMDQLVSRAAQA